MTSVSTVVEQDVVTVTLPPPDSPTTLAQRLSLRVALWLLLRSARTRPAPRRRSRRAVAPVPPSALAHDAATALHAYSAFRQQR